MPKRDDGFADLKLSPEWTRYCNAYLIAEVSVYRRATGDLVARYTTKAEAQLALYHLAWIDRNKQESKNAS